MEEFLYFLQKHKLKCYKNSHSELTFKWNLVCSHQVTYCRQTIKLSFIIKRSQKQTFSQQSTHTKKIYTINQHHHQTIYFSKKKCVTLVQSHKFSIVNKQKSTNVEMTVRPKTKIVIKYSPSCHLKPLRLFLLQNTKDMLKILVSISSILKKIKKIFCVLQKKES